MSSLQPEWWEWIDGEAPGNEPLRLRENAPEEAKLKFEEWKQRENENRAKGIYA